jgi:hypothetical protein
MRGARRLLPATRGLSFKRGGRRLLMGAGPSSHQSDFSSDRSARLRALRLFRNDRDDPMLERAVAMFVHRADHACDGRSHQRQRCFLAAILSIAGASCFDRIGRFDGVHACAGGRGTRNNSATRTEVISETLSNDSGASRWPKALAPSANLSGDAR